MHPTPGDLDVKAGLAVDVLSDAFNGNAQRLADCLNSGAGPQAALAARGDVERSVADSRTHHDGVTCRVVRQAQEGEQSAPQSKLLDLLKTFPSVCPQTLSSIEAAVPSCSFAGSALALACENGHLEAVKLLIEAKADVNERYGVSGSWGTEVRGWE